MEEENIRKTMMGSPGNEGESPVTSGVFPKWTPEGVLSLCGFGGEKVEGTPAVTCRRSRRG
jgi:hypothetical protein